jgi:hypothetical protein
MVQMLPHSSQNSLTSTGYALNPASIEVHLVHPNIVNPKLKYRCQHQMVRIKTHIPGEHTATPALQHGSQPQIIKTFENLIPR